MTRRKKLRFVLALLVMALAVAGWQAFGASGEALGTGTRFDVEDRSFYVWVPAHYDPSRAYPVVLAFHGFGSNGPGFEKWFKMEDHVADAAITVYPSSDGARWDFAGDKDLDFTANILDALAKRHRIDRTRVLAVGFSYGGRFVNHLGCKRPDLVRAIVVGGGGWEEESGCAPLPVLGIHRTNDPSMSIAWGRAAITRWTKIDRCASDANPTEVIDAAHGCLAYRGCSAPVVFCEDTHNDPKWPVSWNHTVREEYRTLAWQWFAQQP